MRVAVLGAGAWGTALAAVLAQRHDVALWARDAGLAAALASTRRNRRYLPEIALPPALAISAAMPAVVADAALVLVATPVAGLRQALTQLDALGVRVPVVWVCKGLEQESGLLPHQVAREVLGTGARCGVLSGPSFALEVAQGLPCALTLASRELDMARDIASVLHGGRMRVYYSGDVTGVEIAGALKNVMAIAVGISDGLGLGLNARAALIARGLAEITRLGTACGGTVETFIGLAGAGDLILTATGDLSRNRRVGLELARGRELGEIVAGLGHVAEGVRTAQEVVGLARRIGVEMPVTEVVNAVLTQGLAPATAVERLLSRYPKAEG